jgi:hypothetical protein
MIVALGIITSWYFIPDSFFVEYSDASNEQIIYKQETLEEEQKNIEEKEKQEEQEKQKEEKVEQKQKITIIKNTSTDKVKQDVPFMVQAPHAQWDESKFQDACEEASLIMAKAWIDGKNHISKNDAEEAMNKMFSKEEELFGSDVIDISASDTARLFQEYYGHSAEIFNDVTITDLYRILTEGNIIIAPTNGKVLGNPQFTNGGPDRHMLVIIGYDKKNGEFITNDPGTRLGRGYKYKDSTLYNAIRDYETGHKKDIEGMKKTVIVIKK